MALTLHVIGLHLLLFEKVHRSWPWLRLVLGASLGIGWLVGISGLVPPASHALLSAGLAGGIIINVVLNELPGERRPRTFLAGILTFTTLLKLSLYLTGTEGAV